MPVPHSNPARLGRTGHQLKMPMPGLGDVDVGMNRSKRRRMQNKIVRKGRKLSLQPLDNLLQHFGQGDRFRVGQLLEIGGVLARQNPSFVRLTSRVRTKRNERPGVDNQPLAVRQFLFGATDRKCKPWCFA